MISRQSTCGRWVSTFSASAPLTLFTANQPMPGGHRVQPGRQRVAPVAEPQPAQHHLRHPVLGPAQGQDPLGDSADRAAEDEGERGLPEAETESRDRENADEDRGELHVRRGPGPEKLKRPAVPFVERNEFRPAGLDLEDLGAVTALPDKDARPGVAAVCDVLIACRHLRAPLSEWPMITSLFTPIYAGRKALLFRSRKTLPARKRLHYILATRTAVLAGPAVP